MTTEFVICVPLPGLEIHYTDHEAGWGRREKNRFTFQPEDAYCLTKDETQVYSLGAYHLVLEEVPGEEYKFLVHLTEEQSFPEIRKALERAGFVVTSSGDRDPETERRRLWFYDPHKPIRGEEVWVNNIWPE